MIGSPKAVIECALSSDTEFWEFLEHAFRESFFSKFTDGLKGDWFLAFLPDTAYAKGLHLCRDEFPPPLREHEMVREENPLIGTRMEG
jgi:hypothetical protein